MKCQNCGYENNNDANFCKKCGSKLIYNESLTKLPEKNNNTKVLIVCITVILVVLLIAFTVVYSGVLSTTDNVSPNTNIDEVTAQSQGSWQLIGSYSGSGSGSQAFIVPSGQIMIKISSFPIKNYATNHLYVTGSNGARAAVNWGPESAVETRSDSLSYSSSNSVQFTIDYYETVSWQVDIYRYQ